MENSKDFLGTQPVGKLLFKLAIPTVIAQLINMLYNIVDRIFIGHIPDAGSLALTGVGVTMPIIMIVSEKEIWTVQSKRLVDVFFYR